MVIKILSIYLHNYWMFYYLTGKTFLVNCLGKVESESNVKLAVSLLSDIIFRLKILVNVMDGRILTHHQHLPEWIFLNLSQTKQTHVVAVATP